MIGTLVVHPESVKELHQQGVRITYHESPIIAFSILSSYRKG